MKFENLVYNKLFASREGEQILADILRNRDLVKLDNHGFWRTKFRVSPDITPTNKFGESAFTVKLRDTTQGELMSMRGPLSHSAPLETPAVESYTGSIPSFSPRQFHENAAERLYKIEAFDNGEMTDDDLIYDYATTVLQYFVDSGNQTLSYAAARVLSTGYISWDKGVGTKGNVIDCRVPATNRLTSGSAVWTDTSFDLLGHLRTLVENCNAKHGEMAWQLELTRNKFENTFLKNTGVLNWIKLQYAIANGINDPTDVPSAVATVDYAVRALAADTSLPRISIIQEKQNDVVLGSVSGWVEKYAVLRPVGYAGYVMHATPIERRAYATMGAKAISVNIVNALDNLGIIINTESDNGELREYGSQFVMNAIPTLDEFLYHYIIDTTTAD